MSSHYTTPFNVWQRLGRVSRHKKTVATLENGDTVELEEHVIPDETKVVDSDGSTVSADDYSIDTKFNQLTYTGTDTLTDVEVNYFTAPYNHDRATRGVEQAESHIENHLNVTFGGLKKRTEEIYETDSLNDNVMMLQRQPVENVETVWINRNLADDKAPDWKELTEDEDWVQYGNVGLRLSSRLTSTEYSSGYLYDVSEPREISENPKQIKVTYTYGYEDVPADIQNLAEILLSTDMFIDTVFGAGVDGRDNFDPQTMGRYRRKVDQIKKEWKRAYYDNFTTLIEKGTETDVQ